MFASVAKPKAKAAANATGKSELQRRVSFADRHDRVGQAHLLRPRILADSILPGNQHRKSGPASTLFGNKSAGRTWDFRSFAALQHSIGELRPSTRSAPNPAHGDLKVGSVDDPLEHDAERVAAKIMHAPTPNAMSRNTFPKERSAQRQPARTSITGAGSGLTSDVLRVSGSPLDHASRIYFETRFDRDFSDVRVHTGISAERSAQELGAHAYTVGHHIVFGAHQFAPGTYEGRLLIAHELAHVVQQRDSQPLIQRQPAPPTKVLSAATAKAAVTSINHHYHDNSIRLLEEIIGRPSDGNFDAADAEALAELQQKSGLTADGKADEPFLDALLKIVGPTAAARSALIHLVIDHAKIDESSALAVVFDPTITTASELHAFPGGVGVIQIGQKGFASYSVMVAEIKKQLAAKPAASPVTKVAPGVFTNATKQQHALSLDKPLLGDRRSIRLLQGALGSKVTGQWDVELVQHVAARQQALGATPDGVLDQATFAAIGADMIAAGSQDAVLEMIVDYYHMDRSRVLNIVSAGNPPAPTDQAITLGLTGKTGSVSVVHVFPLAFNGQPFAGLVHTVAHELGHADQMVHGIDSLNVREFLSRGIEIESKGMAPETIETEADIDLMIQSKPPVHTGFLQDAQAMIHFWLSMTHAEQVAQHQRFIAWRAIIVARIAAEATAGQKTKLRFFLTLLNNADQGVP
jgi:peptidoglycan hydrolase-like protein with peptidoglycan-binding domain